MRYSFFALLLALVSLFVSGCIKTLDSSQLTLDAPQLVVNSLIGNDTTLRVYVTRSYSVVGKMPTYSELILKDAQVQIYQNDTLWAAPSFVNKYDGGTGFWANGKLGYFCDSTLRVKPGSTYRIEVRHAQYGTATATTTIPSLVSLESISIKQNALLTQDQTFSAQIKLKLRCNGSLPAATAVRISTFGSYFNGTKDTFMLFPIYISEDDGSNTGNFLLGKSFVELKGNNSGYFQPDIPFFPAKYINGTQSETIFGQLGGFYNDPAQDSIQIDSFRVDIWATDRPCFEYLTRYPKHQSAQDGSVAFFQGEPFPMYSNISGGFGIWGAYQYRSYVIKR